MNQELKNKWLKGYNKNDQLKIQHFTDFLKAFHEEHKHLLNQTEKYLSLSNQGQKVQKKKKTRPKQGIINIESRGRLPGQAA